MEIGRRISATAVALGVSSEDMAAIMDSGKIGMLNRRPFKHILANVAADLGLVLTAEKLRWVVNSRNSLIHRGRFVYDTETRKRHKMPFRSGVEEYWYDLLLLDRIFLRLLNYEGRYLDPRDCTGRSVLTMSAPVPARADVTEQ